MFFTGISIAISVVAVLILLLSAKLMFRGGWVLAWFRGLTGIALGLVSAILFLLALDFKNYRQLSMDQPIATITFVKQSEQEYTAALSLDLASQPVTYQISGDQWQIDARILRFSGLLKTLGGKPGYQLDRISGRYRSVINEMNMPRSAYNLTSEASFLDVWQWLNTWDHLTPGVQAVYGSAAFLPMADGAMYQLSLGESGLVAVPLNDNAKNAVNSW